MGKSIRVNTKRRGRPVTTGKGTLIGVRFLDDPLSKLDEWIAKQNEEMTRPEAIRRLVEIGLTTKPKQPAADRQKARATEMADKVIDRKIDPGAPEGERVQRKRRLLKGPSEFIDARVDRPKAKK
jgi:hypothetical protein